MTRSGGYRGGAPRGGLVAPTSGSGRVNGNGGTVLLGHEMRLRLDPARMSQLGSMAKTQGLGQTAFAEKLLAWAVDYHVRGIVGTCVARALSFR